MRLLVLDGSRVLHSLVRRLVPEEVEIEVAPGFHEALASLQEYPPQALIVNLAPVELPWQELQIFCHSHSPPIPVLFESCIHGSAEDAGLGRLGDNARFLAKPYELGQLRRELARLLAPSAADAAGEPAILH